MFTTHATYKNGNREVIAVSYDGMFSVCAYVDGVLRGAFDTTDKIEAMEVFKYNCDVAADAI